MVLHLDAGDGINRDPACVFQTRKTVVVAGVLTLYLVATSWSAAKRCDGKAGWLELAAIPVALGCMVADIWLGQLATFSPNVELDGQPSTAYFIFAGLAGLAVALDISMIVRGGLARQQRIARHLWRMCVAYFLAATSLFLGQQDDVFPFMIGSPVLIIRHSQRLFSWVSG